MHALNANARAAQKFPAVPRDPVHLGEEMHGLLSDLYPICRSLTGDGVRATLSRIADYVPLEVREIPTGTQVFDWTIPREWNIRDAFVRDAAGRKVIDFKKSNLHVVSYSAPVHARMSLRELKPHLFTLPDYPDRIPYRTSYYDENWGFCLRHNDWLALPDGEYEVLIDSTLKEGHLAYGEYYLKGNEENEILISTHICHPSLANDNLSGIVLATFLAERMTVLPRRYSYRFLFTPGAIGSITWLSLNESKWSRIRGGLVLACVGDPGGFTYKASRRGDAEIDRAAAQALTDAKVPFEVVPFVPYGYDERQFCSPGIDLPVGCFMKSPYDAFSEYHTSADDVDFVRPEALAQSFALCSKTIDIVENNRTFINLFPKGEPQLGKRGLYKSIGGGAHQRNRDMAMLWVLNLSDSSHSLLDIARKSGVDFETISAAARDLLDHGLLKESASG